MRSPESGIVALILYEDTGVTATKSQESYIGLGIPKFFLAESSPAKQDKNFFLLDSWGKYA